MGAYHKKFQDMIILINSTNSYTKRLTLISGARFQPTPIVENFPQKDIAQLMTIAELYYGSVINYISLSVT